MPRIESRVQIGAAPATVFPWLVDPDRLGKWVSGFVGSEPIGSGEVRVGARSRDTIEAEGRRSRGRRDRRVAYRQATGCPHTSSSHDRTKATTRYRAGVERDDVRSTCACEASRACLSLVASQHALAREDWRTEARGRLTPVNIPDGSVRRSRHRSMSVVINNLTVDCRDPKALADFWTAALGWHVVDESDEGVMIAPFTEPHPGVFPVYFQENADDKVVKNRWHFDLARDQAPRAKAAVREPATRTSVRGSCMVGWRTSRVTRLRLNARPVRQANGMKV